MAPPKKSKIREQQLVGFKYFHKILRMLDRLHDTGCARDRAHNRQLHFDQYIALVLLYFFNPIVTSLRGMQQASELKKVQRKLGVPRASLGSLSEAVRVFDSELLVGLIGQLTEQLKPMRHDSRLDDVQGILTLVDGSALAALPRLTKAMWSNSSGKGLKLHTHFELLKNVPIRMDLTDGGGDERRQLKQTLLPDRVYVMDRGYASFDLFKAIESANSSFVCRMRDNSVYDVIEKRTLSDADRDANIVSDQLVSMNEGKTIIRLIRIKCTPHQKPYKIGRPPDLGPQQGDHLLIATNLTDASLNADLVGLIYAKRWSIEIFFRFFKHVLGCRHLISHNANGIEIQTYCAIIACLLIALWTGCKPTLRTYEMICFYFTGLADEDELTTHLARLAPSDQTR